MPQPPPDKSASEAGPPSPNFAARLLKWNRHSNHRQMPWKGEKDPYKIWLSEIILQQTRVEQGLAYYQRFVAAYPTVQQLAAAPDEAVFKLWEGLGYYSRCRNLLATARQITNERAGLFPVAFEDILALKGVGRYTAAAIASFAYNSPYAVLDGNVFRVLSRIYNNAAPVDTTTGRQEFTALAQRILPQKKAAEYNQAIMDFGATICKPQPLCGNCFFNKYCAAYLHETQLQLPVKQKKAALKERWMAYFIVECAAEVLVQQRTEKDIWRGLHQFVLMETAEAKSQRWLLTAFEKMYGLPQTQLIDHRQSIQLLSHRRVQFHLFYIRIPTNISIPGYSWVSRQNLQSMAFPKTLQQAIADYQL